MRGDYRPVVVLAVFGTTAADSYFIATCDIGLSNVVTKHYNRIQSGT